MCTCVRDTLLDGSLNCTYFFFLKKTLPFKKLLSFVLANRCMSIHSLIKVNVFFCGYFFLFSPSVEQNTFKSIGSMEIFSRLQFLKPQTQDELVGFSLQTITLPAWGS